MRLRWSNGYVWNGQRTGWYLCYVISFRTLAFVAEEENKARKWCRYMKTYFCSQNARRDTRNYWSKRDIGRQRKQYRLRRRPLRNVEWYKQRGARGYTSDFLRNELDAAAKFLLVQGNAAKNINEILSHGDRRQWHSGNNLCVYVWERFTPHFITSCYL